MLSQCSESGTRKYCVLLEHQSISTPLHKLGPVSENFQNPQAVCSPLFSPPLFPPLLPAFASSRGEGLLHQSTQDSTLRRGPKGFMDSSLEMQASVGIIVNTFEKLKPRAIRAIVDGEWMLISTQGSIGKLLLTHRPSLSIHIFITNQAYDIGSTTAYISSVSATVPSIVFHFFPTTTLPPDFSTTSPHHETLAFELLCLNNPNVHRTLTSISKNHVAHGFIIDSFYAPAVAVASELNIPYYYFFTSGTCFLDFFLYAPTLHDNFFFL